MTNVLQQKFLYGEVGSRLLGLMNTEAYSLSVKSAENVIITPIGSLRAAPKFSVNSYDALTERVLDIQDTKFKYSFIITENKLYSVEKDTFKLKASIPHNVQNPVIFNTFENFCVIGNLNITEVFEVNKENGTLGVAHFYETIKKPLRNKKTFQGELYKWLTVKEYDLETSKNKDVKKLIKLQTYKDPIGFGTNESGNLKINGANKAISRIYCIASTDLSEKNFDSSEFNEGDYIFNFYGGTPENVVINNTAVTLSSSGTDKKSQQYYATLSVKNIAFGNACIGEIIKIDKNEVKDICVFQNRLCMATDTELFFSELFNYTNFLGNEKNSGAFYLKPSPIKSVQPNIRKLSGSRGLWINTDRGYYILGFNNTLSENDSFMYTATDKIPTLEQVVIGEVMYFIDIKGVAYNVKNTGEQILNFSVLELDKFDVKRNAKHISSITIDGTEYAAVIDKSKTDRVYLYRAVTDKIFSRVSLLLDNKSNDKLVGWYDNYFLGNKFFIQTDKYVDNAKIGVLPPYLNTRENGLYMNNDAVNIKRIVVKVLNEDNQAVKRMDVDGTEISNINDDIYNTYVCNTSFQLGNGFDIEIELSGTDKVFEILGIEQGIG